MGSNVFITGKGWRLHERVRKRQVVLVRRLNDHYIFVSQALPLIAAVKAGHEASTKTLNRKYSVPSRGKARIVSRTDEELARLYSAFIDRDLFGTLLIAIVSLTESFLIQTLRIVLREYPHKLSIGLRGAEALRQVPLATILDAKSREDVLESIINSQLCTVFYASPRDYLTYFHQITGVRTNNSVFSDFIEIKATRDLLVHNSGKVNEIYLAKAGTTSRARNGQTIPLDKDYFDHSLMTLKKLSTIVSNGICNAFTKPRRNKQKENDEADE